MENSPFVVGLTGGIGSGKSTVARAFVELGATLVDTDREAHALTAPGGPAIAAIRAEFGDAVIADDGSLDRPAMRKLVFTDAAARKRLEAILHPMIGAACEAAIQAAEGDYVLLDVPLLVESGNWINRVDRVLVVDCDEERQIERVIARSGLSPEQIRAIMDVQATREERRAAAHDVIDNNHPPEAVRKVVARHHQTYVERARAKASS